MQNWEARSEPVVLGPCTRTNWGAGETKKKKRHSALQVEVLCKRAQSGGGPASSRAPGALNRAARLRVLCALSMGWVTASVVAGALQKGQQPRPLMGSRRMVRNTEFLFGMAARERRGTGRRPWRAVLVVSRLTGHRATAGPHDRASAGQALAGQALAGRWSFSKRDGWLGRESREPRTGENGKSQGRSPYVSRTGSRRQIARQSVLTVLCTLA